MTLLAWGTVAEVQETIGAFIRTEGLKSSRDEDNERLWEVAGMTSEGFREYTETVMDDCRANIARIVMAAAQDPELGLELIAISMTATHISGVLAGAAATRQVTNEKETT